MIPPMLHNLLCLNNAVVRRTSRRSFEIFKESNMLRDIGEQTTDTLFGFELRCTKPVPRTFRIFAG